MEEQREGVRDDQGWRRGREGWGKRGGEGDKVSIIVFMRMTTYLGISLMKAKII